MWTRRRSAAQHLPSLTRSLNKTLAASLLAVHLRVHFVIAFEEVTGLVLLFGFLRDDHIGHWQGAHSKSDRALFVDRSFEDGLEAASSLLGHQNRVLCEITQNVSTVVS